MLTDGEIGTENLGFELDEASEDETNLSITVRNPHEPINVNMTSSEISNGKYTKTSALNSQQILDPSTLTNKDKNGEISRYLITSGYPLFFS